MSDVTSDLVMPEALAGLADLSTLTLLDQVHLDGEGFTEGPVWHPEGYLTFVRHRLGQILRWEPGSDAAVIIRENSGRCSSHTFNLDGDLVLCEADNRRITRIEPGATADRPAKDWANPNEPIAEEYRGTKLNKPNDLVTRSDGSIYFTDPQAKASQRDLGYSAVFRIAPDGQLHLATDECEDPNGLAFSPDESVLYVAISRRDIHCVDEQDSKNWCRHRIVRAFDVARDGSLSDNRVFADMYAPGPGVPDGMKVDADGRVYITGTGGLWVYEPDTTFLGIVPMPVKPRNLCFGGPDLQTLFVCAGEALYSLDMNVRGISQYWG
jgi:gluconolactonase